MHSFIRTSAVAALVLVGIASVPAASAEKPNYDTFWNIQKHFGVVPKFFNLFPETKLAALWTEYRDIQLNPNTALDGKTKQLIGLAVAAQARCAPCIYFQSSAALANGATFKEIQEAVAVFVTVDNWSKYLPEESWDTVKKDTDTLVSIGTLSEVPKPSVPMYLY